MWINNHFIATTSGGTGSEQTNAIYTFPNGSVQRGRDNVITVIQVRSDICKWLNISWAGRMVWVMMRIRQVQNSSHDMSMLTHFFATEKSPRGIPGFKLNNGNFTTWKVQGKLGGYTQYVCSLILCSSTRFSLVIKIPRQDQGSVERRWTFRRATGMAPARI